MSEKINDKIHGMNRELFIQLAFCRAYEIEFGADEYHMKDSLDYSKDYNYCSLEDVIEDENISTKIDEYAQSIRNFIKNL